MTIHLWALPHPGGIGAGLGLAPPVLPDAFGPEGLPVSAVEAEQPVGLVDGVPAVDIGERHPVMLARADVLLLELSR